MTALFDPQIAQWTSSNFPKYILENGPMFVSFVKAYYEWLQQSNNVIGYARSIPSLTDIDETLDQFVVHFKNEYMDSLPANVVVDQRLLVKNITDLYRAKGSKKSYELLFRILFNEDIKVYLPGRDVFKLSDNQWVQESYIEVNDSVYLNELVGNPIHTETGFAIVEDYHIITIANKVINVLTLSNVSGNFAYGDHVLSAALPNMTIADAPTIVGSLSKISIEDGGAFYNIGDILNVTGSGSGAQARVASVVNQNGKVVFKLINGGYGFSINPNIQITGGYGAGATFKVGSLSNISVYVVNIDTINTYSQTQIDITSEGFELVLTSETGAFTVGENVSGTINSQTVDFSYISGNPSGMTPGNWMTNTALGLSYAIVGIDNPNFMTFIMNSTNTPLSSANLVGGIHMINANTGVVVQINSTLGVANNNGSGNVTSTNSTSIFVNNVTGNFLPTMTVTGATSGHSGVVAANGVIRETEWEFVSGYAESNLNGPIDAILSFENMEIGTISSLIGEYPGEGYSQNPTVVINEPLISQLEIPDGIGGFWGADANVSANAVNANGIVTGVQVVVSGFGYVPNENLTLSSANTANNQTSLSGVAVVDSQGISQGYWTSNRSFLSDKIYLQDSNYYQAYSYEILAPRMLDTYQQFIMDLVHPVGFALFGRYWIDDLQVSNSAIAYSSFSVK